MDAVDISVALLLRDAATALPKLLAHLEQQTYPAGRFEIIAVDRASTDDTYALLERHADGSPVKLRPVRVDVPDVGAARNRVVRESRGRWVLFLDSELLASPKLVESHIRAQDRHGGACATVGRVEPHPQVEKRAHLRHFVHPDAEPRLPDQPLRFLDWRCWNLSAPRASILAAGGFDESFALPGLEDVELAWRLEHAGLPGYFSADAVAYAWQPIVMDREFARCYSEGFALSTVMDKTRSDVVMNRYLGPSNGLWSLSEVALAPLYQSVCRAVAAYAGPVDWVCRRMSRTAVIQGLRDAKRGKPPRYQAAEWL